MPPRYYGIDPVYDGEHVVGIEKLGDMWQEIDPLAAAHHAEVEQKYRNTEWRGDYHRAFRMEREEKMVVVTARKYDYSTAPASPLVGYSMWYVLDDMFVVGRKKASNGAIFVLPEHRSLRLFLLLHDYCKRVVQSLGADCILTSAPTEALSRLYRRLGYTRVAEQWTIELAEENGGRSSGSP